MMLLLKFLVLMLAIGMPTVQAEIQANNIDNDVPVNHLGSFVLRVLMGGVLLFGAISSGLVWYWSAAMITFVMWFTFNTALNLLRTPPHKPWYLGSRVDMEGKSKIDRILQKLPDSVSWFFLLMLAVISISIFVFYGELTYNQIAY